LPAGGGDSDSAKALEDGKGLRPLIVLLNPKGQPTPVKKPSKPATKRFMASNDALALAATVRGSARFWVPEDKLRKNKIPVLSLIGEVDPMKDGVDQLQSVLVNLKVVVIPSANHLTAPGDPDLYKKSEGVPGRSSGGNAGPQQQDDCNSSQKTYFNANCRILGSFADWILPNVVLV